MEILQGRCCWGVNQHIILRGVPCKVTGHCWAVKCSHSVDICLAPQSVFAQKIYVRLEGRRQDQTKANQQHLGKIPSSPWTCESFLITSAMDIFVYIYRDTSCKLLVLGISSKHSNRSLFSNIWMLKYFTRTQGFRPRFSTATTDSRCLQCWMPLFTSNFCNGASFSEVLEYAASIA